MYGNAQLKQPLFYCHGRFYYIIQVGVLMARKGNAFVAQACVNGPEHIVPAHGSHLLRGRETAVVAYDAAYQACSKQGVRALQQGYAGTVFGCLGAGRTAGPSASYNYYFHNHASSCIVRLYYVSAGI